MAGMQTCNTQHMCPWYGVQLALLMMFTNTWSISMTDPMSDMLLAVTVPITIVLLGAIYLMLNTYLETRDDCSHTWSRWSDPQKSDAHPYQTRNCNRCNMHQQRIIQ
jgi:hypothetical protein